MSDLINKRGGCSIHGAATCFQSRAQPDPGGLGPLIVRADLGNMAIVDFPEKKIDKAARGFRGFPPDASFHLPYLNHLGQTRGHLRGPGQTSHVCIHAQTGPLKGRAKAQAVLLWYERI